jgi:excisionase family DNA binding protein
MSHQTLYTIANSTEAPFEHYNTIPELMRRTRTSESYWRKLIQKGRIRCVRFGANVRIAESDFLEFVGGAK